MNGISKLNNFHFESTHLKAKLKFGLVKAVLLEHGEMHTALI